jgi:hypothetical protein
MGWFSSTSSEEGVSESFEPWGTEEEEEEDEVAMFPVTVALLD